MSEPNIVPRLSAAIGTILELAGDDIGQSSETESYFTLRIPVRPELIVQHFSRLCHFADLVNVTLEYEIQEGRGAGQFLPNGIVVTGWSEDPDLSPPELDATYLDLYASLVDRLSIDHNCVRPEDLEQDLTRLAAAHARIAVHLSVTVTKTPLSEEIGHGAETRCLLYIVGEKLAAAVDGASFEELSHLLVPNGETSLVILIGNALGKAEGPTIRMLGRGTNGARKAPRPLPRPSAR